MERPLSPSYSARRVRIESELFGDNDKAYIWHSRCGMLQLAVHTESVMTNEMGEVMGTMVSEESYTVKDIELNGRRGCGR